MKFGSAPAPAQPMTVEQARAQAEVQNAAAQSARVSAQAAEARAKAEQQAKAQAEASKSAEPQSNQEKKDGAPSSPSSGENKEQKPETVQRAENPPKEADPSQLDVKLDERNLVPAFNFEGQPWPAVLQWYAKLANCAYDYQELPNSYINVFTDRPHTLDEVRDLLNRYLLARGFTMLERDRVISVSKIEKVDPSLVQRISELELYDRKRYDFVKVAFELPEGMEVDKAKEDLKQVLSPNARVIPLAATRQLLILDAVANLQTVSGLLNEERARRDGKMPLREFPIVHRKAEDVIDILYVTLGLDPKSRPTQQELEVEKQRLQVVQQLAQQNQNQQQNRPNMAQLVGKDAPPVFLTYNRHKNSILANAPPDYMRMIEFAIARLDVPEDDARANFEDELTLKEIRLTHRRAEDIVDHIYIALGLDPKSRPSPQEMQNRQLELQIIMQAQQRGQNVQPLLQKSGPAVFLVVNRRNNSIIANAPPEQMRMIEFTLARLDVPLGGNGGNGGNAAAAPSAIAGDRKMKSYKLTTLNPQSLKTTLEEMGTLDPFTVMQVDVAGRSLFVEGCAADHDKIAQLIRDFDGEERKIKMIQLRSYPAELAAVSIRDLVIGKKEEKKNSDPYYDYLISLNRGRNPEPQDPHEGFYIAADNLNNRLLVRANSSEMELIVNLLKELGEVPTEGPDGTTRIVDVSGSDVLEQLQKAWSSMGGNPLIVSGQKDNSSAGATTGTDSTESPVQEKQKGPATEPPKDRDTSAPMTVKVMTQFARFEAVTDEAGEAANAAAPADAASGIADESAAVSPAESAAAANKAVGNATDSVASPPPVHITVTADGRLIITSKDAAAVGRLEDLISKLSPQEKRFKIFRLQHTTAYNVYWNVLYYAFDEELNAEDGEMIRDWYTGRYVQTAPERGDGLARRPKLMITYENEANSIIVANATSKQLQEISDLIEEYDKPRTRPEGLIAGTHRTATIKIQYSRASIIASTLKEVYVDLLSARDKEFDTGEGRRANSSSERLYDIKFGASANGETPLTSTVPIPSMGALTVGADDVSNILVVSCKEELFDGIVQTVRRLDMESAPQMSFVVHPVSGSVTAANLGKAMTEAVGRPWLGRRPEEQAAAGGARGPQGENRGGNNNQPPNNNRGRNARPAGASR